ncbi:SanA/YdcF family protein [Methylocystis parvus]|uniref:SanA/YdcF family protein n=1 Tax=Methylocystis parvus TaxID=134 RepID=UPI003C7679CF
MAPVEAGLVLGASPIRRDGEGHNRHFLYRIEAATALYKAGKVKYLIVSGDRRDDFYEEPAAMRDALIAAGVPADRIYRDAAGFHTRDSLARAHLLFGQRDAVVISQRFHAERAVFIARAHGLAYTGFAAWDIIPVPAFAPLRAKPSRALSRASTHGRPSRRRKEKRFRSAPKSCERAMRNARYFENSAGMDV